MQHPHPPQPSASSSYSTLLPPPANHVSPTLPSNSTFPAPPTSSSEAINDTLARDFAEVAALSCAPSSRRHEHR